MSTSTTDFNADSRDRLWAMLEIMNINYRDRLKESVDTAGAELEWLKPGVFGGTKKGFYCGPAVMAPLGTVMLVLANKKKVFTIHMAPASGHADSPSLSELIEAAVEYYREVIGEKVDEWSVDQSAKLALELIRRHGRAPGKGGDELERDRLLRIFGCLLSTSDDIRADIVSKLEEIVSLGICPALIGLFGRGEKPGAFCGIWPLLLPLAPYLPE